MDVEVAARERDEIVARYGPWTAHNIRLGDGTYTMSPEPTGDEVKLRRIVQLVSDLHDGKLAGLRILDLACLEGMYSLELAKRGAHVVAIEGREANIEKARFAARSLGLEIDFQLGDVRDLSVERHGMFDVVLCLGILYHLDRDDVLSLVERIRLVTRSAAIFDTAVATEATESHTLGDLVIHGERLFEHDPGDSEEERLARLWSSLDNPTAFLPTLPSLLRLLAANGFSSVLEAHVPVEPEKPEGRVTLVALSGSAVEPLVTPVPPRAEIPETRPARRRAQGVRALVPAPVRRLLSRGSTRL
jgi:SAM-dependent methyltransferase